MGRFKARELRDGTSLEEIRRTLNEIQKELAVDIGTALSRARVTELIIDGPYAARYGDVVRVAPPSGGLRVMLPPKNLEQPGARIVVVVEGVTGALSVEAVNATVNGADTVTYLAGLGTVEFQLTPTGWYGWSVALVDMTALAGAGLSFAAGALAVNGSSSITIASDQVQRAALTGDVTATLNSNATTIAANAVTNAKLAQMVERRVKLRADGAGTGDPIDGTGAQLAEIIRFNTEIPDSTSTGTITTYALANATNVVRFLVGVGAAITLRGATIPASEGQLVIWENNDGSGSTVTINHEDGSAAAAGNRFRCPGAVNYSLTAGHRIITCYINTRWRIIGTA